jgi:hypothetical protein
MQVADQLADAFSRVQENVHAAIEGLTNEQLVYRVDADANTIAWLAWHLTRIQDDHIAHVAGTEQRWTAGGWVERFALPFDARATGYGHTSADLGAVRADAQLLLDYYDDVHAHTLRYVATIDEDALDRVVDERWDPPVTLGVRLVSVVADDLEHAGQMAYVRGIAERAAG